MQISQSLPQFNTRNSLIIVSVKHGLEVYNAYQGEIKKIKNFKIESPSYSDNEGFFMSKSKDVGTVRTGSVLETSDENIKRDFFQQWKDLTNENDFFETIKETDDIYLFAPSDLITEFKEKMSAEMKEKIVMEFQKNYYEEHPFKFLEKIDEKLTEKISKIKGSPKTEEERKILEIGQK